MSLSHTSTAVAAADAVVNGANMGLRDGSLLLGDDDGETVYAYVSASELDRWLAPARRSLRSPRSLSRPPVGLPPAAAAAVAAAGGSAPSKERDRVEALRGSCEEDRRAGEAMDRNAPDAGPVATVRGPQSAPVDAVGLSHTDKPSPPGATANGICVWDAVAYGCPHNRPRKLFCRGKGTTTCSGTSWCATADTMISTVSSSKMFTELVKPRTWHGMRCRTA